MLDGVYLNLCLACGLVTESSQSGHEMTPDHSLFAERIPGDAFEGLRICRE